MFPFILCPGFGRCTQEHWVLGGPLHYYIFFNFNSYSCVGRNVLRTKACRTDCNSPILWFYGGRGACSYIAPNTSSYNRCCRSHSTRGGICYLPFTILLISPEQLVRQHQPRPFWLPVVLLPPTKHTCANLPRFPGKHSQRSWKERQRVVLWAAAPEIAPLLFRNLPAGFFRRPAQNKRHSSVLLKRGNRFGSEDTPRTDPALGQHMPRFITYSLLGWISPALQLYRGLPIWILLWCIIYNI